jgi:hypothetical protein
MPRFEAEDWVTVVDTLERAGRQATDPLVRACMELQVPLLRVFFPWLIEQRRKANIDFTHNARIMHSISMTSASMMGTAARTCMPNQGGSTEEFTTLMDQLLGEMGIALNVRVDTSDEPVLILGGGPVS